MAQREYIPVLDDGAIVSESPLIYVDTLYYETLYRISGNSNWTQQIDYSPLPTYLSGEGGTPPLSSSPLAGGSPATGVPCILLKMLPDGVEYDYKIRRFDSNNVPSEWVSGTFVTGTTE